MRGVLFSSALLCLCAGVAAQKPALALAKSFEPGFIVAAQRIVDLDGDGRDEIVVLGNGGEVRVFQAAKGKLVGELDLPDPERSLVTFAKLGPDEQHTMLTASPRGVCTFEFADGKIQAKAKVWLDKRQYRFNHRVGVPRIADFAQDVNADGRDDLVLPGAGWCLLFLNRESASNGGGPNLVRTSRLDVDLNTSASTKSKALSDELKSSFTIPDLRTLDVNGDGRLDLIAEDGDEHRFHIQDSEGRFPTKPSVLLNLELFRDTTPEVGIGFGETLASNTPMLHIRDLNSDGIPDYVIAHRRKVWAHLGTKKGPNFDEAWDIKKLPDDVSVLMVENLDDDGLPDLLLLKVRMPQLRAILKGYFFQWEVTIGATGFANLGGDRGFAATPKWRRETVIQLPSIRSLLAKPDELLARFRQIGRKFVLVFDGDLNGDKFRDVLSQSEDKKTLSFWLMDSGEVERSEKGNRRLRELLFGEDHRAWDLERIFTALEDVAKKRTASLTRDRPASGAIALRDPEKFRLVFASTADLEGDSKREVVLRYLALSKERRAHFDILRLDK